MKTHSFLILNKSHLAQTFGSELRLVAIWWQFKMERYQDYKELSQLKLLFIILSTLAFNDFGLPDFGEPKEKLVLMTAQLL